MRTYLVCGTDDATGKDAEMNISREGMADAAAFAESRGLKVRSIRTDAGVIWVPDGRGGFEKPIDESARKREPDAGMILLALLVPLVGLIVGGIRLANRGKNGLGILIASVFGMVIWALILANAGGN